MNEWHETIRRLAHEAGIGERLMIAPPGYCESAQMRVRFQKLLDFLDAVRAAEDADERRFVKVGAGEPADKRPNDRVEGRDAALSRRVPSHDGLCGNGSEVGAGDTAMKGKQ